jgi:hypothetical protein
MERPHGDDCAVDWHEAAREWVRACIVRTWDRVHACVHAAPFCSLDALLPGTRLRQIIGVACILQQQKALCKFDVAVHLALIASLHVDSHFVPPLRKHVQDGGHIGMQRPTKEEANR